MCETGPPALVISPHLDDAVFSCGAWLAACPGSVVVTVLAGLPPATMAAPPWDAGAGFASARAAVLARREEDRSALAMLRATPLWLDFLDGQYGVPSAPAGLAQAVSEVVAAHPDVPVLAPAGVFHRDHLLVHAACAQAWAGSRERAWLFYEDAIHRRTPGQLQRQLMNWHAAGLAATPQTPLREPSHAARKARAVAAYASQLPLFGSAQLADLSAPERYWRWLAPDGAQPRLSRPRQHSAAR
ncbi:PIG-L deacetylase family protein [Cupriavidus basilensis]